MFGYQAKQVRENSHSFDFVNAFWNFFREPRCGEIYNLGGGRQSNCSTLEAIGLCERLTGRSMEWNYNPTARIRDHIWWVSDNRKFESHYPNSLSYDLEGIMREIHDGLTQRLAGAAGG